MKTLEMFVCASLNPETKYQCFDGNVLCKEFWMSKNGYFHFLEFDCLGNEIEQSSGSGGFNGNLRPIDEWVAKPKSVDFMTAANSGKRFKPKSWIWSDDKKFRDLYDNLEMFSGKQLIQIKILNGKWYIED